MSGCVTGLATPESAQDEDTRNEMTEGDARNEKADEGIDVILDRLESAVEDALDSDSVISDQTLEEMRVAVTVCPHDKLERLVGIVGNAARLLNHSESEEDCLYHLDSLTLVVREFFPDDAPRKDADTDLKELLWALLRGAIFVSEEYLCDAAPGVQNTTCGAPLVSACVSAFGRNATFVTKGHNSYPPDVQVMERFIGGLGLIVEKARKRGRWEEVLKAIEIPSDWDDTYWIFTWFSVIAEIIAAAATAYRTTR